MSKPGKTANLQTDNEDKQLKLIYILQPNKS